MTTTDMIMVLGLAAPMITAIICLIIVATYSRTKVDPIRRKLNRLMACAYICQTLIWVGILLYFSSYKLFARFNVIFLFSLLMNQVVLYHFVFILTATGNSRRFRSIHYLIPTLIALVLGIGSFFVPLEVRYDIVRNAGALLPGYFAYSLLFVSPPTLFVIYTIFYSIQGLRRIRLYREVVVNYSADEERSSLRWLFQLCYLILLTLSLPLYTLIIHKSGVLIYTYSTLLIIVAPMLQYVIICNNMVRENYLLISSPTVEYIQHKSNKQPFPIDRKRFEKYMQEKKPYLNPKLKITDMLPDLYTNRSYLSSFINKEYNMNFSRYINQHRLLELDRLRTDPVHADKNSIDLILIAGFSNYRAYFRAKNREDKKSLLYMN